MATTPNLGLHQWDAEDAFLREEFNENSGRIDAAAGLLPLVKLLDVTTQTASGILSVDLRGVEWEKYHELRVYARVKLASGGVAAECLVRCNGRGGGIYSWRSGGSSSSLKDRMMALQMSTDWGAIELSIPCRGAHFGVHGKVIRDSGDAMEQGGHPMNDNTLKLSDVTTLDFMLSASQFAPGCEVKMYGVRVL